MFTIYLKIFCFTYAYICKLPYNTHIFKYKRILQEKAGIKIPACILKSELGINLKPKTKGS